MHASWTPAGGFTAPSESELDIDLYPCGEMEYHWLRLVRTGDTWGALHLRDGALVGTTL